MKMVRIFIFVSCFLLFLPIAVIACKCVEKSDEVHFTDADAVFVGEVVKVDEHKEVAAVEVISTWKGLKASNVYLYTNKTSCGFNFREDRTYLFYAQKQKGKYTVEACSGSVDIDGAKESIAELGEGSPPSKQVTLQELKSEADLKKWGVLGIVILSIGIGMKLIVKLEKSLKRK
ncbi:hypothetical protein FGG79_18800 [Bacillus sp. BHET2]|uniref:hypothetical protein n=1 Tax=Bacillus sp. BHET2 TaxID=2583818 RepID=UPI00110D7429|nr:hypothetical protein [Bacillus sp. BHET2]TMU83749.1 hypothetical protein FGG79_18800 [Bacillus sp. BHET2]